MNIWIEINLRTPYGVELTCCKKLNLPFPLPIGTSFFGDDPESCWNDSVKISGYSYWEHSDSLIMETEEPLEIDLREGEKSRESLVREFKEWLEPFGWEMDWAAVRLNAPDGESN